MPATLGYWKIRGLVQHIKLLLEYTGTEYIEKQYMERPVWLEEKFNLGLDFPNLPYYIDGDHKITQSNAILRYIARKHDLVPKTEEEVILADMLENEAMDLRMGLIRIAYNDDYETLKGPYQTETMPPKLEHLSKFLGDKEWFLGSKITYVDFFLYEALDVHKIFSPAWLDKYENLRKFLERFEDLKPIKEYMNSTRFIKSPMHGPQAKFGN